MPLIGSCPKQPAEDLMFTVDYAAFIAGRTVDSLTPTITPQTGITATFLVSGQKVNVYFSSGTNAVGYRIKISTAIVIGGKLLTVEDEVDIVVAEVPNTI